MWHTVPDICNRGPPIDTIITSHFPFLSIISIVIRMSAFVEICIFLDGRHPCPEIFIKRTGSKDDPMMGMSPIQMPDGGAMSLPRCFQFIFSIIASFINLKNKNDLTSSKNSHIWPQMTLVDLTIKTPYRSILNSKSINLLSPKISSKWISQKIEVDPKWP